MKDIFDFFVWIWSLIVLAAYYTYEAGRFVIGIIVSLYTSSYQYMLTDPHFQSVPYLGKVLISGLVAGIVPLIGLAILQSFLSTTIRGHLQDSGLDRVIGTSSANAASSSTSRSANRAEPELALRPYVTYEDPSVHVSRLRKGLSNSWTAEVRQGNNVKTINIGSPTTRGTLRINTFGSNGTVEWGN